MIEEAIYLLLIFIGFGSLLVLGCVLEYFVEDK